MRALIVSLLVSMPTVNAAAADGQSARGRPVRVLALAFHQPKSLAEIAAAIDREAAKGTDIVVLPETFMGQTDQTQETLDGATMTEMARLAKKHHTYIVCPMDRKVGAKRYNSAVLLDREGKTAFIYNKVYPYFSEYDLKQPVDVGADSPAYQADFGKIGFAICFDANFPEVWQRLADLGIELVLFPSAYYPGARIQAHAMNHSYYVVAVTGGGFNQAFDITGRELLFDHSDEMTISRITLDLDRGMYHTDFNLPKRDALLKEHPDDVVQEPRLTREGWYFVLRAARPGVSVRELARRYGLEEYRDYINRSRREIDARRGSSFSSMVSKEAAEAQSSRNGPGTQ